MSPTYQRRNNYKGWVVIRIEEDEIWRYGCRFIIVPKKDMGKKIIKLLESKGE
jgi:hypothetical protein